jgi:alkylresorcinol/alkylpyrone synthase
MAESRPVAKLRSIATAVPRHVLRQADVMATAEAVFGDAFPDFQRLLPVYANATIDERHSCVPLDWYRRPHDLAERNALYIENAVTLLVEAADRAISGAGLRPDEIDGLVVVSTSGIATPSLDALLIERMGLRRDVERLPIFGLGCAGGVLGLARAAQLALSRPDKIYLFLVVELCTLTFLHGDVSKSNVIATALFADGAAGAVVSCQGEGPRLRAWAEHTWPGTLDIMGWDVVADGLKVVFSRDIPSFARAELGPVVEGFLASRDLTLRDIDRFVCHPGGAKVLDALEQVLGLEAGGLAASRSVLRRYGNMSGATVMFVLEEALRDHAPGRSLMTTFGPGFTAGMLLLESS